MTAPPDKVGMQWTGLYLATAFQGFQGFEEDRASMVEGARSL